MSTFLQLSQQVASESGTISGTQPSSVANQTGRLGKIVQWTKDAWISIQTSHSTWRWMRGEFEGPTIANQQRYDGSDFGVTDRFADWICTFDQTEDRFSMHDPDIGVSDEGRLVYLDWDTFYTTQLRGAQTAGKPYYFSIDPEGKLALSPKPDKAYIVRGPYLKDVQELSANGDIPEMPARFHRLIVEAALMYLGTHDESPNQLPLWRLQELKRFSELERDQLPKIQLCGPLA